MAQTQQAGAPAATADGGATPVIVVGYSSKPEGRAALARALAEARARGAEVGHLDVHRGVHDHELRVPQLRLGQRPLQRSPALGLGGVPDDDQGAARSGVSRHVALLRLDHQSASHVCTGSLLCIPSR